MRIQVENIRSVGGWDFGHFVGLYLDPHGDTLAMVLVDGMGLYLQAHHPSKVRIADPDLEEAAGKEECGNEANT